MKKIFFALLIAILSAALHQGAERIVVGKEAGEGGLIYPRQLAEGPDGNIYVFDQADSFIKVYSPEGRYLRKLGGKGEGPGEIKRADGLAFGFTPDGKIFFTEYFTGHPWITILELSGELNKVVKIDIKEWFGVDRAVCLPDGNFLTQFSFIGMPKKENEYFLHSSPEEIMLLSSAGAVISRIKRMQKYTRISFLDQGADLEIPFAPAFAWDPFNGKTILFSNGLSTKLEVYDHEGKKIREVETPLPKPKKVTGKDLAQWKKERKESISDKFWYNQFGRVIEKYDKSIYDRHAILWRISLTPAGNILVYGEEDYWLLDGTGKLLARVSAEVSLLTISDHFLLFRVTDEDENFEVHLLKRKGTEEEDLLRLQEK